MVDLDFEDRAAAVGAVVPSVANNGWADLRSKVATYAGGRVHREEGRGSGYAIRFPEHTGEVGAPAAILQLWVVGAGDALSPDRRDFSFGADVLLDEESSGSDSDDGDNVIQRGLYEDEVQYKLQLDHGVPSCRLAGTAGSAIVHASVPIDRGEWYRITCERREDVVSLMVEPLDDAGAGVQTSRIAGEVGAITLPRLVPFAVGGKVDAEGQVVYSATDQFNGVIDNVSFQLLHGA